MKHAVNRTNKAYDVGVKITVVNVNVNGCLTFIAVTVNVTNNVTVVVGENTAVIEGDNYVTTNQALLYLNA